MTAREMKAHKINWGIDKFFFLLLTALCTITYNTSTKALDRLDDHSVRLGRMETWAELVGKHEEMPFSR